MFCDIMSKPNYTKICIVVYVLNKYSLLISRGAVVCNLFYPANGQIAWSKRLLVLRVGFYLLSQHAFERTHQQQQIVLLVGDARDILNRIHSFYLAKYQGGVSYSLFPHSFW